MDKVQICNLAVSIAGAPDYIQSLDENSVIARRCSFLFEPCAEMVLRLHAWNSATASAQLAENTSAPGLLYENSFALPHDCVKVINVFEDADAYSPYDRWKISGRNIETGLSAVYLRYIQMPEDYRQLDVLLADSIAHCMAMRLAPSYIKDKEMLQLLSVQFERVLQTARAQDTLENKEAFTENSPWEDSRVTEN